MAVIEAALAIERLTAADADAGLALSRETNWNQTLADWRVFVESGIVFGIRDDAGRVIATAALLPSPPVTWISMVLVTPAWRRRGLADRLMRCCIAEAQARGWQPWLDATPAGVDVYRTLDFVETGFGLLRMRRPAQTAATDAGHAGASSGNLDALLFADRDALGFDRAPILRTLSQRAGSIIYRTCDALALVRDGDRARHIGPAFASDDADAIALLEKIVACESAALLVDIADDRPALRRWCDGQGFVFERPFSRMCLRASLKTSHGRLIAVAGPEFG